jgi:hypothetical protein
MTSRHFLGGAIVDVICHLLHCKAAAIWVEGLKGDVCHSGKGRNRLLHPKTHKKKHTYPE